MIRLIAAAIAIGIAAHGAAAQTAENPAQAPDEPPAVDDGGAMPAELAALPGPVAEAAQRHFGQNCEFGVTEYGPPTDERHRSWPLAWTWPEGSADAQTYSATLHELWCSSGAYNMVAVYILESAEGEAQPVFFSEPVFDVTYTGETSESDVEALTVKGFGVTDNLINADFDAETKALSSYAKWRGVGDAFSVGTWVFIEGRFVLTRFLVDASYNGEQDPIPAYEAFPDIP